MRSWPRHVVVLGAITALAVVVAVILTMQQGEVTQVPFQSQPLTAGLKERLNDIVAIKVQTKDDVLEITRNQGIWVLPAKGGYPAKMEEVRTALIGLSDLTLVEPKTANPARHDAIGLGDPIQGGNGILATVSDFNGTVVASLILSDVPPGGGADRFYVRWPSEDQTYIAKGTLDLKRRAADWIENQPFPVQRGDVAEVTVTPPSGVSYSLQRATALVADFDFSALPDGRSATPSYTRNTTAYALNGLTVSDVRPAKGEMGTVHNFDLRLFDGDQLKLALQEDEGVYWIRLVRLELNAEPLVSTEPGEEPVSENIDQLAERRAERNKKLGAAKAWDFAIPQYKFEQFTKPLEDLLEPLDDTSDAG